MVAHLGSAAHLQTGHILATACMHHRTFSFFLPLSPLCTIPLHSSLFIPSSFFLSFSHPHVHTLARTHTFSRKCCSRSAASFTSYFSLSSSISWSASSSTYQQQSQKKKKQQRQQNTYFRQGGDASAQAQQ